MKKKKKFYLREEEFIEDGFTYSSCLFPYFPSRADIIEPLGTISLEYFLDAHKNPKEKVLNTFKQIEEASSKGNKKLKDELKQTKLSYFTPSTCLSKRNYEGITCFTGIMVMEYDKLGLEEAIKLKRKIFKRFKSCICAYLSPSKTGCKFLFKIPKVNSVDEYKEYFYGLASYLDNIEGFDSSSQNPTLPLFLSYDFDMLIRTEDELQTWVLRGYNPNSIENKEYSEEKAENISEKDRRFIFNLINKKFREIDETEVGHKNVVNLSLIIGGYCGAGYLSEQEAIDYIAEKITESSHCNGRKDYYKTCERFIKEGMSRPLILKLEK